MTGKKHEPPLFLDMDFEEALNRFSQTDKKEVDKLVEQARKKKKPPGDDPPTARHRRTATPPSRSKER